MKVLLKHKKIFRVIIILSSIACLVCAVSAAEPEENPTLLDLENFPMAQNSILAYFFRQVGWLIVKRPISIAIVRILFPKVKHNYSFSLSNTLR